MDVSAAIEAKANTFDGRPGVEDRFGRALRDLRISVTDRCNFRCTYCMPAEIFGRDYAFLPQSEVLTFEDVPDPVVGPEEALVDVRATALNRADLLQRMGLYPSPAWEAVEIPGLELAGVVAATGPRVTMWQPGDAVMGIVSGGAYAERVATHERQLMAVPSSVPLADAAAIPEVFLTAWDALVVQGGLTSGRWALVHAGASGVGTAAIQIAKLQRSSPSRYLLPINYAVIVGGTCTLIGTSTNILVSSLAQARGLDAFSMFEFLPMGAVFVALALAYSLVLVRFLPDRGDPSSLTSKYELAPYLTEVRVPATSRLVGRTVLDEKVSDRFHLNVLEILRGAERISYQIRATKIEADDILIVRGTMEDIVACKEQLGLLRSQVRRLGLEPPF